MYFRRSRRTLNLEKEEWSISMAVDAFMEQEEQKIDRTKYKFYTFMPRTHCAHLSFGIHRFIRQLTLFREWCCAFGFC
jgi:hypothetical protein